MKPFQYKPVKLLFMLAVCSFAGSSLTQGGAPEADSGLTNNARLIVCRAADFGTLISLTLAIDGVQVTTLALNYRYEALLRPGKHKLSIGTVPSPNGQTKFTHRHVTVHPGQTYAFTALWEGGDNAVLQTGHHSNRPIE